MTVCVVINLTIGELYSFFDVTLSGWNILKARYTNSRMKAYKKDL